MNNNFFPAFSGDTAIISNIFLPIKYRLQVVNEQWRLYKDLINNKLLTNRDGYKKMMSI